MDVFGRTEGGVGGNFSSATAKLTINTLTDMLCTQAQVQYQQQLSRVYNLANDKTYFVVGRTSGTGSIGYVIGPTKVVDDAVTQISDPCQDTTIKFSWSSCTGDSTKKLTGVVGTSVGFTVQAQDMVINGNLGFQFCELEGKPGKT